MCSKNEVFMPKLSKVRADARTGQTHRDAHTDTHTDRCDRTH